MPCPYFAQIWIFQITQGIKTIFGGYIGEEKNYRIKINGDSKTALLCP
jgi:hypothetical protein